MHPITSLVRNVCTRSVNNAVCQTQEICIAASAATKSMNFNTSARSAARQGNWQTFQRQCIQIFSVKGKNKGSKIQQDIYLKRLRNVASADRRHSNRILFNASFVACSTIWLRWKECMHEKSVLHVNICPSLIVESSIKRLSHSSG